MVTHHEEIASARWFAGKDRAVEAVLELDRLEPPGARGGALHLVDVAYAEGGSERYALPLRDGRECDGDDPLWGALARSAGVETAGGGHFLAQDISNTVVLLDDDVVLKLYRRPEPGTHPEVELLAALTGSTRAPELLGALEREGTTLASAQRFVRGVAVGWERLIARLAAGDTDGGEPAELGRVTAELHRTLLDRLGPSTGAAHGAREVSLTGPLAALTTSVEAGLEPLRAHDLALQRVHGDLHVGQVLRTEDGLVVVDWEGEPGLPRRERARPRPALRDLASLRLSLAHAARAAHRRTPSFDWRAWSREALAAARDAYATVADDVDDELLHALELEKELTELAYAERWLPEWLYVPRAVLPFVVEERL